LFSFSGTNGIEPEGQLLQALDGNLYGTARDTTLEKWGNANFGFKGNGMVFRITTNGVFSTLAFFTRTNANGAYPRAGLALGSDGSLYGTTTGGGVNQGGTVYKIAPNGTLKILVSFSGNNGSHPMAGVLKAGDNAFYGTTFDGGLKDSRFPQAPNLPVGGGTVFRITSESVLKTLVFFDNTNGSRPSGELIQGHDACLYGVTGEGGLGWLRRNKLTNEFCGDGFGTVFKMTPNGTVSVLAAFNGYNGMHPTAIAQSQDGDLFGITTMGGATNTANRYEEYEWSPFRGEGTVFKIAPNGKLMTLVLFYGPNGKNPDAFVLGNDGNFYGTTAAGGAHNLGTVFKLTPNGKFIILHSFTENSGTWQSRSTLLQGMDGNLYGTTSRRGANQCGSVFRLTLPSR
jgi:uncharacterized repeat protein (TIGR03803 family)